MFNNGELEKMFGSKRVEVLGGWRKLHNEEHYDFSVLARLYWSDNKNKNGMGGAWGTRE